MIFDTWLDMPVWGIFGSLAAMFFGSAALIHWLCFGKGMRARSQSLAGVVAPFFGSVAVLFALLTGFLANDVWDRNQEAARAVLAERDSLLALNAIGIAAALDPPAVQNALRAYGTALVEDEWPRMHEQDSSATAGQALLRLLTLTADPRIGTGAGSAVQGALLSAALKLRSSRDDRLAVSGDRTDRTKWAAVLFLALITQIAVSIVHLEKPRAQLAALAIFSAAVVITLGLIAIRERPFDGPLRVSAAPLEEALQAMAGRASP